MPCNDGMRGVAAGGIVDVVALGEVGTAHPAPEPGHGRVCMQRPFVVMRARGSAWDDSKPMEDQKDWPAHAAFMDSLTSEGFILLGGPLEGTPAALLIFQAQDRSEIEARLAEDPWTRNGLLITKECWPWRIRLGSLH